MSENKNKTAATENSWFLYMIRSADGSLYTGITTDTDRRLSEHRDSAKGAKALRGKQALSMVYRAPAGNRSEASKLEYRVKQLSKSEKEALVAGVKPLSSLVEPA